MVEEDSAPRERLHRHAAQFRSKMSAAGFSLRGAGHPIIPVMIHDAVLASKMAAALLEEGIYVIAFSFPVVPKGLARIRTQMSAGMTEEDIERAVGAFSRVGKKLGIIS